MLSLYQRYDTTIYKVVSIRCVLVLGVEHKESCNSNILGVCAMLTVVRSKLGRLHRMGEAGYLIDTGRDWVRKKGVRLVPRSLRMLFGCLPFVTWQTGSEFEMGLEKLLKTQERKDEFEGKEWSTGRGKKHAPPVRAKACPTPRIPRHSAYRNTVKYAAMVGCEAVRAITG